VPLPLAVDAAPNPWLSWSYLHDNADAILAATRQHVTLTVISVGLGLLLALPLAVLARQSRRLEALILGLAGVIYTIPSLALFAVLAPITGLTQKTVVIGLTAYTLIILVRNVLTGLQGVPPDVVEAARGMGLGPTRLLLTVQLPLAVPAILAGVRVATVSTIALVTVGAVVSNGGLGQLIFEGFNNNFYRAEILTATLLCVLLAAVADALLLAVEWALTPWSRR
jgi:osmoprotectant transport system permease protein